MQLAYPRHGRASGGSASLDPHLDEDALQVLLHRHGAAAQDVAYIFVGLSLDHPINRCRESGSFHAAVALKVRNRVFLWPFPAVPCAGNTPTA